MTGDHAGVTPAASIVIPTFNEAGNIAELLGRLTAALPANRAYEIIFVDDSLDDTPEVIEAAARGCARPVRLLRREQPAGGLGGAVAAGIRAARAPWVVVMDADLQHPPELVPELLEAGARDGADLVVASRYTHGGSRRGLGGGYRVWVSGLFTVAAKALFARRLRGLSDPMSGFFAIRRSVAERAELRPLGYKILLELAVRCRPGAVSELPYEFGERFAGDSKSCRRRTGQREGLRFLRHLLTLRLSTMRALAFGAIGLSGFVPNLVVLWLLTGAGMHYLPAEAVASQVAIVWNFLLVDLLVFRDVAARPGRFGRLGGFLALGNADLLARIPLLAALAGTLGLNLYVATVLTLGVSFLARFFITDRFIYRTRPEISMAALAPWLGRAAIAAGAVVIALTQPGPWLAVLVLLAGAGFARLAGWQNRQLRIVVLAMGVFVAATDYLSWRLSVLSLSFPGVLIGVPLLLAEMHAALHTVGLHATLWPRGRHRSRPGLVAGPDEPGDRPVYVFVPTVDEGPAIVEPTLRGVLAARDAYLEAVPHARFTIVVCNDGGVAGAACSTEVIDLARRLGVHCVTRTIGGGAKAGNIEHARQRVGATGDALVVIFDADQVPHAEFFVRTLRPFADPAVGWVQTGQFYGNRDNPVARWADDQQSLFYRLLCPGKAAHDSAFICGTNVVIRATALDEIGGLPTDSVTEDFAASVELAPRWRSVYLPGVLAVGLGPVDLGSYLKQQERWARGTLSVLRTRWRQLVLPRRGGLNAAQRLQYGLAVTHYLCGVRDLIFVIAPVLFLTAGISGVQGATLADFLGHFLPYYLLALLAFWHAARGITSWRAIVIGYGSFAALVRAAWMTAVGSRGRFTLTPKRRTGASPWRAAWPQLAVLAGCGGTLMLGLTVHRSPAYWLASFWLGYLCALTASHLWLVRLDALAGRRPATEDVRVPRSDHVPPLRLRPGRRMGLALGGIALTAACAAGATAATALTAPSAAEPPAGVPPTPRVGLSGAHPAQLKALRERLGIPLGLQGRTLELGDRFDTQWARKVHNSGGVPWLTLVLSKNGAARLDSSLTAISNGVNDAELRRWARQIAAYGRPLYLTMLPLVDRNYPATSAVARGGIPQDVPRAWHRLRRVFREAGASNAAWVWNPADPAADKILSPPDREIDAVGLTLFEYPGTRWAAPAAALHAAAARHPGRPLLVAASVAGPPRRRSAWLLRLGGAIAARRDVAGLVYHVSGPVHDPAAAAARPWSITADGAGPATVQRVFTALTAARRP